MHSVSFAYFHFNIVLNYNLYKHFTRSLVRTCRYGSWNYVILVDNTRWSHGVFVCSKSRCNATTYTVVSTILVCINIVSDNVGSNSYSTYDNLYCIIMIYVLLQIVFTFRTSK